MKYIPELGYELTGLALAHWEGTSDLAPAQQEAYRKVLLARPKPGVVKAPIPVTANPTTKPQPSPFALQVLAPPCPHRGEKTGEIVLCRGCGQHGKQVELFHCSHFNEPCYTGAARPDRGRSCMRCEVPKIVKFAPITHDSPIVIYHIAQMGDWQEVVCEQLSDLSAAGLTEVRATILGGTGDWLVSEAKRRGIELTVVSESPRLKLYESPGIAEVARLAAQGDRPILYLHTKGVSTPGSLGKRLWRRVMMKHLVRPWRDLWPLLNSHHAIGCNWMTTHPQPHFAGNFWIARADYLRALPPWETWWRKRGYERFSCESWIGSAPHAPRMKSLLVADVGWGNDAVENFSPHLE